MPLSTWVNESVTATSVAAPTARSATVPGFGLSIVADGLSPEQTVSTGKTASHPQRRKDRPMLTNMYDMGACPLFFEFCCKAFSTYCPRTKKPPRHRPIVGFAGGSAGMAVYPATAPWLCATAFRRLYSGQRIARETRQLQSHTCLVCFLLFLQIRRPETRAGHENTLRQSPSSTAFQDHMFRRRRGMDPTRAHIARSSTSPCSENDGHDHQVRDWSLASVGLCRAPEPARAEKKGERISTLPLLSFKRQSN